MLIPPKLILKKFESDDPEAIKAFGMMFQDSLWINAKTYGEQCSILISYLHNEQIKESISKLGKLFESPHCVQKQYYKI